MKNTNKNVHFHVIINLNIIESKWIVNEISLKNFFKYTDSVYQIGEEINSLKRQNLSCSRKPKTKASTVDKMSCS